jgi:hypothetical protein
MGSAIGRWAAAHRQKHKFTRRPFIKQACRIGKQLTYTLDIVKLIVLFTSAIIG